MRNKDAHKQLAQTSLTSVIRREPVLSLWYSRRQEKGAEILPFKPNVKII